MSDQEDEGDEGQWRRILVNNEDGQQHRKFPNNSLVTSKYTALNFLPKNLFQQFRRLANFYFLVIAALQLVPGVAPVNPLTSILPLLFVVGISMIKQAFEDYKRHQADAEVNNRIGRVLRDGAVLRVMYKDIKVGDIVQVEEGEEFPCDIVLLSTTDTETGNCYITTANLDGETSLKVRTAPALTRSMGTSMEQLTQLHAILECGLPDAHLYVFQGRLSVGEQVIPLSSTQLLLKGARLKNTSHICGVCVYTGKDTKLAMNQKVPRAKFSSLEKEMNSLMLGFLAVVVGMCLISTGLAYAWRVQKASAFWFLDLAPAPSFDGQEFGGMVLTFLTYLSLYNYCIPISLYVTIELQKFFCGYFIRWDADLYDADMNVPALVNTTDLNEELGVVEYVFSDKTGTLTENDMVFECCTVEGRMYGVNPISKKLVEESSGTVSPGPSSPVSVPEVNKFLWALAICHTCHAEKVMNGVAVSKGTKVTKTNVGDFKYHSPSPDEEALVRGAAEQDWVFLDRSNTTLTIQPPTGEPIQYDVLYVLEFDSFRKRMSIVVRDPRSREIHLICKGAESLVLPRCRPLTGGVKVVEPTKLEVITAERVTVYAERGLRTLVLAHRLLSEEEWDNLKTILHRAETSMEHREEKLRGVYDAAEQEMTILGASAIRDRLQDGVPETMDALREACVKVWVLTGDKRETAENVCKSCRHFSPGMTLLRVQATQIEDAKRVIKEHRRTVVGDAVTNVDVPFVDGNPVESLSQQFSGPFFGLVIDGETLRVVCENEALVHDFLFIASKCAAVLCCRMSPIQKAEVISLVKKHLREPIPPPIWNVLCPPRFKRKSPSREPVTLAIGDGANDVAMIQEAHVGVGIEGKEGRQAARSSDYAFGKFASLRRLLLVHGRWSYQRMTTMVLYLYYKNVAFILAEFYFSSWSGYSAQTLYDDVMLTFFNAMFTALPILLYGVFEQDMSAKKLLEVPQLYAEQRSAGLISNRRIFEWMLLGLWHSLVAYFGVFGVFAPGVAVGNDGLVFGLWSMSGFVYTVVIFVVTLKLALHSFTFSWPIHFGLWGSLLYYLAFMFIYCALPMNLLDGMAMFFVYEQIFNSGAFYFTQFLLILLALIPDYLVLAIRRLYYPQKWMIHQEADLVERKSGKVSLASSDRTPLL